MKIDSKISPIKADNKIKIIDGIPDVIINADELKMALAIRNLLDNAIKYLKYKKITLVYDEPQIGADNKLITFIHPKSSPGMLIELCQKA